MKPKTKQEVDEREARREALTTTHDANGFTVEQRWQRFMAEFHAIANHPALDPGEAEIVRSVTGVLANRLREIIKEMEQ